MDSCQRLSTSYHVQEADIDEMFDFADADSDGRLSFQEFEVVVNVMSCKKQFCEDNIGRQPIAVSDISIYICLIDIRSKSKEQLKERRAGLSNIAGIFPTKHCQ